MKQITIIGLMSGSSLDGVDIAAIRFDYELEPKFNIHDHEIIASGIVQYPQKWRNKLQDLVEWPASSYFEVDAELGKWYGEQINQFITQNDLAPELISIHGHTVLHDPEKGISKQVGSGPAVHAVTNIPVVCDFRTMDVLMGGQGAPMAPIADKYLFNEYDIVINFGGIANIAMKKADSWIGFDVCPANQILNFLARQRNQSFDDDGTMAARGKVVPALLQNLKRDPYLVESPPKSLSNKYVSQQYLPILDDYDLTIEDRLATATEFIADQIQESVTTHSDATAKVLCTGGGAHNKFLVQKLQERFENLTVPDDQLVNFKECILMALMGLMRLHRIPNFYQSITGGRKDHIGGVLIDA